MEQINARSIFSPATGFIRRGGFDWTCNPYVGCSFGLLSCSLTWSGVPLGKCVWATA
jgi:hypothetical protein